MNTDTELNNYLQPFCNKYGNFSNLIWISKKRRKYILEFDDSQILIINDVKYNFDNILSCKMEKAPYNNENSSEPYILLIGTNDKTNLLISITVWSRTTAKNIHDLIQNIIQSSSNK